MANWTDGANFAAFSHRPQYRSRCIAVKSCVSRAPFPPSSIPSQEVFSVAISWANSGLGIVEEPCKSPPVRHPRSIPPGRWPRSSI